MAPINPSSALSSLDDLLERSQRLEVEALAQVHDLFYQEVYRYVRFRLDDDRLVEDVTSDVFLFFLETLARQDRLQRNLRGWLLDTAASLVNASLRGRPRKLAPAPQAQPVIPQNPSPGDEQAANPPEAKRDLQRAIRQALANLPADQQHLLAVRFAEGRSLEETAQAAALDLDATRLQQFRALDVLRRRLDGGIVGWLKARSSRRWK